MLIACQEEKEKNVLKHNILCNNWNIKATSYCVKCNFILGCTSRRDGFLILSISQTTE